MNIPKKTKKKVVKIKKGKKILSQGFDRINYDMKTGRLGNPWFNRD